MFDVKQKHLPQAQNCPPRAARSRTPGVTLIQAASMILKPTVNRRHGVSLHPAIPTLIDIRGSLTTITALTSFIGGERHHPSQVTLISHLTDGVKKACYAQKVTALIIGREV
jgi:hypothetical protein